MDVSPRYLPQVLHNALWLRNARVTRHEAREATRRSQKEKKWRRVAWAPFRRPARSANLPREGVVSEEGSESISSSRKKVVKVIVDCIVIV